eukprot:28575-Eustigmatos_ZCMA.PRE.1
MQWSVGGVSSTDRRMDGGEARTCAGIQRCMMYECWHRSVKGLTEEIVAVCKEPRACDHDSVAR